MNKQLAIIGLGKMGSGLAQKLLEQGWEVHGMDPSKEAVAALEKDGLQSAASRANLVQQLDGPRIIWLMVPAGKVIDDILFGEDGFVNHLQANDIIIDGGNSNYNDTKERGAQLEQLGFQFMDVGVSGGPSGARNGACIMAGGSAELFAYLEPLLKDLSVDNGYAHFDGIGAGHFVKMVHNGIEYGMMQAIAEGFTVMKEHEFHPDLQKVAGIYNHGSVITSSLIGWMENAYKEWGQDLQNISGEVHASGEGEWTIEAAKELGIETPVIVEAFEFRQRSKGNPTFMGKVVSALRGQFGGHPVFEEKEPKK